MPPQEIFLESSMNISGYTFNSDVVHKAPFGKLNSLRKRPKTAVKTAKKNRKCLSFPEDSAIALSYNFNTWAVIIFIINSFL